MEIITINSIEKAICKEIKSLKLSVSHDAWHINKVLEYATFLQQKYGGDLEIIRPAVMMHDLGRNDPKLHGQKSISASLQSAELILQKVKFPQEKANSILTAILEHDKAEYKPISLESRILKDADFLAGFGAWGVLRIAMWAGETNNSIEHIMERIEDKMLIRLQNLEFSESKRIALKDILFADLFQKTLCQPPLVIEANSNGKYLVFEGISGAGKDTQVRRLKSKLLKLGHTVRIVREPTDEYKTYKKIWERRNKERLENPEIMRHLLLADRYELMNTTIIPALQNNEIVISVRSFLSTLVYQCVDDKNDNGLDIARTGFLHQFVPIPDLVILFDIDEKIAWGRIQGRKKRGVYEKPDLMTIHRERYKQLLSKGMYCLEHEIIDASLPKNEVSNLIFGIVNNLIK